MRTNSNTYLLRRIAATLLATGAASIALDSLLGALWPTCPLLLIAGDVLGLLLVAVGLAFWSLGHDRRAGVIVDGKGLLLNLGHSSAFIAWDNIERAGTSQCFTSVLMLGSRRQFGIALRDVQPYIQSYEERLPGGGPIKAGLRLVQQALRARHPLADEELALYLATCRRRSGYDVLVPEALLGQSAILFAEQVEAQRARRAPRQTRTAVQTI